MPRSGMGGTPGTGIGVFPMPPGTQKNTTREGPAPSDGGLKKAAAKAVALLAYVPPSLSWTYRMACWSSSVAEPRPNFSLMWAR